MNNVWTMYFLSLLTALYYSNILYPRVANIWRTRYNLISIIKFLLESADSASSWETGI